MVGASMGAFQALEWTIHFPIAAERAILIVPALRAGNVFRSVVGAMIEIIALDPRWRDGRYVEQPLQGLAAAGRVYFPWTVADGYLQRLDADVLERDVQTTVQRTASWDAWNLIRRYQASASHDISAPFGGDIDAALRCVRVPLLVLPTTTDRLLGLEGARAIAQRVSSAEYHEIESERGHLGWRPVPASPEMQAITSHIRNFLSEETR